MEIKAEHLTRTYRTKKAIDNLNFSLPVGVYGLLGNNGAGKSTLMRMLAAIDYPSSGKILLDDKDIFKLDEKYRNLVGYIPQDFEVYPSFTATEFLAYIGALKGLSKKELKRKIPEVLQFVNLEDVADQKVKTFSGGMKRRVGIAQAIINDPQILIFDEPTAGLDPHERIRFSNVISEMGQDKIILFSTHIVSDIEAITTKVMILDQGKILKQGHVQKLLSSIEGKVFVKEMDRMQLASFKKEHCIVRIRQEENLVSVRYLGDMESGAKGCEPTLEDYYIYVGGGSDLLGTEKNME